MKAITVRKHTASTILSRPTIWFGAILACCLGHSLHPALAAPGSWTLKAPMPMALDAPASCEVDGILYVIGGGCMFSPALDTVEAYDPQGGVAPQLLTLTRESADSVRLAWQGEAGRLYGVESKLNLATGPWTRVKFSSGANSILATNELVEATCNVPTGDTQRFFRVLEAN